MRSERALGESEELHRITMENILDPVFITDDEGRYTFVCANVLPILGYTVEEVRAMGTIHELLGDPGFRLDDLLSQGEIHNIERVIADKGGRKRVFLVTVKRVSIQGGTVLYTCHDITERKQAEEALAESRSRMQGILDAMQDLVCVFDRESRFTQCYAPDEALYLGAHAFLGRKHAEVMPPHIDALFSEAFAACREGKGAEYEYALPIDGQARWYAAKLSPMYRDGEFAGAVSVIRDITERRRAEAAVTEERERLARELHDSVTQLLYTVNLCAMAGQRALASGDREVLADSLDQLGGAAQQALKELRLMLYELRPSLLAEEGLVRALQRRLDAIEGRVGVRAHLSTSGEGALPQGMEQQLYWIAMEALNNALKHAQASLVTVDLALGEGRVELVVADDGRGFLLSDVDATTGMGLVTMRERAGALNGTLSIRSAPGEGTQIKVVVPIMGAGHAQSREATV